MRKQLLISSCTLVAANMLPKQFKYSIANPNTLSKVSYSTEYTDEYFDVYSPPIRSQYAQVFWSMMEPVPLPEEIVRRFANKTIAITGYEADQVMKTPQGDVPVPITHAYNHHYVAWLNSEHAELREFAVPKHATGADHSMAHGGTKYWKAARLPSAPVVKGAAGQQIPMSTVFSEANGGEYRGSYHGYPKGYAQLLYSPATFHINPMQIDTKNRDYDKGPFRAGPVPKAAYPGVPEELRERMSYSGLVECPCTDRLERQYKVSVGTIDSGRCATSMQSEADCFAAGQTILAADKIVNRTVSDESFPDGCSIYYNGSMAEVSWNTAGKADCRADTHKLGAARSLVDFKLDLQQEATMTITGPADVWFGVSPGASSMCLHPVSDECQLRPYGIIVAGEAVTERYLDVSIDEGRGSLLEPALEVVSNIVQDGLRTVVITRPLQGPKVEYYSFNASSSAMYFLNVLGKSLDYTEWPVSVPDPDGLAKVGQLNFVHDSASTCICQLGVTGTLGGNPWGGQRCAPAPLSDLLDQQNPTCSLQTYAGGLQCARHLGYLLDKDQAPPWKDVQEYHMKFRFYFREYNSQETQPLVRLYWMTEAYAGEYDVVQCDKGTPPEQCVQTITSRFKVKDIMQDCGPAPGEGWCAGAGSTDPSKTLGVKLIYAGPHCHAPDCISMELYNAKTGKLLCGMQPEFGKGTETYNEEGYVALPPCLWGNPEEGLLAPPLLPLDAELLSIKKNNNTYGHYGEMASWQMRGVLVPKTWPRHYI